MRAGGLPRRFHERKETSGQSDAAETLAPLLLYKQKTNSVASGDWLYRLHAYSYRSSNRIGRRPIVAVSYTSFAPLASGSANGNVGTHNSNFEEVRPFLKLRHFLFFSSFLFLNSDSDFGLNILLAQWGTRPGLSEFNHGYRMVS